MTMEARQPIRDYVADIAVQPPGNDEDDLIETGVIDSIRVLDLINFVADRFGVEISERDVFDGHFASIAAIAAFVSSGERAT